MGEIFMEHLSSVLSTIQKVAPRSEDGKGDGTEIPGRFFQPTTVDKRLQKGRDSCPDTSLHDL